MQLHMATNDTVDPLLRKCGPDRFHCVKNDRCIPESWVCDKERDCPDASDELKCGGKKNMMKDADSDDSRHSTRLY